MVAVRGLISHSPMPARLAPQLLADICQVLERHGYQLPEETPLVQELVLARVEYALRDLVERFEGRVR
ncbi:hypothetical protein Pka01_52230 [Planotetraspora kaengkrachanensis]|uniref:Uncharacterized protein n=2 Tax=Planotetraspora kaengkrachanensis TaxID=575193 RepID=A0A8J3PVZ5_9ACTN|nr:hypothetical protein Pka01_52230 [Planotetraspora kaengkrachanensis]